MGRATERLGLIHTDLGGPVTPTSAGGARYWLTFTNDFTCIAWIYFLKVKGKASAKLQAFTKWIELQTNHKVKRFCSDNGDEYGNKKAKAWMLEAGI